MSWLPDVGRVQFEFRASIYVGGLSRTSVVRFGRLRYLQRTGGSM